MDSCVLLSVIIIGCRSPKAEWGLICCGPWTVVCVLQDLIEITVSHEEFRFVLVVTGESVMHFYST